MKEITVGLPVKVVVDVLRQASKVVVMFIVFATLITKAVWLCLSHGME